MTDTNISILHYAEPEFSTHSYFDSVLITTDQYFRSEAPVRRASGWEELIIARLAEIERLSPNWDHAGGLPVTRLHANRAIAFISKVMSEGAPQPDIVPLADGGVQLEWYLADGRLDFISDDDQPDPVVLHQSADGLVASPLADVDYDSIRERLSPSPEHSIA